MCGISRLAMAFLLALSMPAPQVFAASDDIQQLRDDLEVLKRQYEERIRSLEQRLEKTEKTSRDQAPVASQPATRNEASLRPANQGGASKNSFNPAISLVLQGTYADLSRSPDTYRIAGFIPGEEAPSPGDRGFSPAGTDLSFYASIDPYFSGRLVTSLSPDGAVEVEEAYFQTTALSHGLVAKGGRFFSGIGYLNEIHQHAWDFVDAPLAYQAFLGGQYVTEGVQVKWVAPTPLFLELGAEAGNGRRYPGSDRNKNGFGAGALMAHLGGDVGAGGSWRAGVSAVSVTSKDHAYEDSDSAGTDVTNAVSVDTDLWIADFVYKWAPNGDPSQTYLKVQGEYFRQSQDGEFTFCTDPASGCVGGATQTGRFSARPSGWYLQSVYQFARGWRVGLRYDSLSPGAPNIGLVTNGTLAAADFPLLTSGHKPRRSTAMLDYSPSEFSRIRLQFARDESRPSEPDNQIFIQYLFGIGAETGHKY